MHEPDSTEHPLMSALQLAFGQLVDDERVDIVKLEAGNEPDACEVQADDWTLFLDGWPLTSAWIAIDEDVSGPQEFRTALEAILDESDLASMQVLDHQLDGGLSSALAESTDGLSVALAAMISADVEQSPSP